MRVAARNTILLLLPFIVWSGSPTIITSVTAASNTRPFRPKTLTGCNSHSSSSRRSPMATSPARLALAVDDDAVDHDNDKLHEHDDDDEEEATHLFVARGGAATPPPSSLVQNLKIGFYFGLWYALNIVYNSKYHCLTPNAFIIVFWCLLFDWLYSNRNIQLTTFNSYNFPPTPSIY